MSLLEAPPSLGSIRQGIADHIAQVWPAVFAYVPDDIAELPCVVVGPFSLAKSVTGWTATVPVLTLGRPINTFDAQRELEELMWSVVQQLERVKAPAVPGLKPTTVSADTQNVAGLDIPAYEITVTAEAVYC